MDFEGDGDNTGDFDQAYYDYCGDGCRRSTTTPTEEEDKIENNLTDPCAKNIFEELNSGSLDLNALILTFFDNSDSFKVVIGNESLKQPSNGTLNARTSTAPGVLYITLDDRYLQRASSLSIARTMIHESFHGYLKALGYNTGSLRLALLEYVQANPSYSTEDEAHHSFMTRYIREMAYSLHQWDINYGTGGLTSATGNSDTFYYESLFYAGLELYSYDANGNRVDSALFQQLQPNQDKRNQIVKAIDAENTGLDSRAKDCTQ